MSFTTEEKLSISTIIPVSPELLDAQIASLGTSLTTERETAVRTELARWTTAGGKFVKIWPMESNQGVETDSDNEKGDIRRNIAVLLGFTDYLATDSRVGTIQIASGYGY